MTSTAPRTAEVCDNSGNLFADLCLPEADGGFLKAEIVADLYRVTVDVELHRREIGQGGVEVPTVVDLIGELADGVSVMRLGRAAAAGLSVRSR